MSQLHPFVRELKRRRRALGLTQTEVAKAAGVSKTTICEIEAGMHEPRLTTFLGYAQAVGLTWSEPKEGEQLKPSVGRIVHYLEDGKCLAALVTQVRESEVVETVDLAVFAPGVADHRPRKRVFLGEPTEGGTWHWPERVE